MRANPAVCHTTRRCLERFFTPKERRVLTDNQGVYDPNPRPQQIRRGRAGNRPLEKQRGARGPACLPSNPRDLRPPPATTSRDAGGAAGPRGDDRRPRAHTTCSRCAGPLSSGKVPGWGTGWQARGPSSAPPPHPHQRATLARAGKGAARPYGLGTEGAQAGRLRRTPHRRRLPAPPRAPPPRPQGTGRGPRSSPG